MNNVDKVLSENPKLNAEDMTTGGHILTAQEWTKALVFTRGLRPKVDARNLQSGHGIRRPRHMSSIEPSEGQG